MRKGTVTSRNSFFCGSSAVWDSILYVIILMICVFILCECVYLNICVYTWSVY